MEACWCGRRSHARGLCKPHYDAGRRSGGPASAWQPVRCPECGAEVPKRNGRQVYCSRTCHERAERSRKAARKPATNPKPTRPCARCGETTTRRKFCSDRCKDAEKYRRYLASGMERAKMDRRNARYVSQARPPVSKVCARCGQEFLSVGYVQDQQRFCSRPCRVQYVREQTPELACHGDHRRRSRLYGCQYEPGLSWHLLFREDGPSCWLCGDDVDPADKRPTARSWACGVRYPSVDHVIPLARGGHHVRSNVRLAHMGCNSARGARLIAA